MKTDIHRVWGGLKENEKMSVYQEIMAASQ
jgi:hypothetical protein